MPSDDGHSKGRVRSRLDELWLVWQAEHKQRLTLEELSERTGLAVNFLHRFRHDQWQLVDREKLEALCEFFDVTPDSLLWQPATDEEETDMVED